MVKTKNLTTRERFIEAKKALNAAGKQLHDSKDPTTKMKKDFDQKKGKYQKLALKIKNEEEQTKKKSRNNLSKTSYTRSNPSQKSEKYSKQWRHIYIHNKPALQHQRTKEIVFPSEKYINKHHPRGPWDS